jgi:type II secretory pathway pseudopilin PulG
MTLVEVLVAVLIMVVVAMGLIPLFSRSIRQNREGANFMELTNVARSTLEQYLQLDFNAPQLTLADGQPDIVIQEYWHQGVRQWLPLPADLNTLPIAAQVERTILIQQFSSGDLILDGKLDTPHPGGTSLQQIQLKRIRVMVRPLSIVGREFATGRPTPIALEVLKAV